MLLYRSNTNQNPAVFFPAVSLALVEYDVVVELNLSDVVTLHSLRSLLNNGSISLTLSPTVNITAIDITTGKIEPFAHMTQRVLICIVMPSDSNYTFFSVPICFDENMSCQKSRNSRALQSKEFKVKVIYFCLMTVAQVVF